MKSLLITRPDHDDTTHYLYYWHNKTIEVAKSKNVKVLDLSKKRANKKEVNGMLSKQKPSLVIFNGHGNKDEVTGYNNESLIKLGENEKLLKDKIIYAISCRSAKNLGKKSIKSGTKAYIGYKEDFVFFFDANKQTHPLADKTAKLFLEPPQILSTSLVKGVPSGEAHKKAQEKFMSNIKRILSSEATKEETTMARYLWWDLKNQVCLGDETATF